MSAIGWMSDLLTFHVVPAGTGPFGALICSSSPRHALHVCPRTADLYAGVGAGGGGGGVVAGAGRIHPTMPSDGFPSQSACRLSKWSPASKPSGRDASRQRYSGTESVVGPFSGRGFGNGRAGAGGELVAAPAGG